MSKMSQISAEMDEHNVLEEQRNSLIDRVSVGMREAEKKIDSAPKKSVMKKLDVVKAKQAKQSVPSGDLRSAELVSKVKSFAERTHNVVTLDGKSYVKVGVYQYLARALGLYPEFDFADNSTQTEVWCICRLKRADGFEITHTTMYADKQEDFLKDKPDYAVIGTAQTRAFSRAMKNIYGYLIELAGYQSAPIEEITLNKENK